jgi:hypothetical protein
MRTLITLNVGGTRFTTYACTLRAFPTGTLASMVDNADTEEIFIDRDSTLFAHILNCHRDRVMYTHAQLGLTCSKERWDAELAYFALTIPTKKRPLDIVAQIHQEKAAKHDPVRDAFEELFVWMLEQTPPNKKDRTDARRFVFTNQSLDPSTCPVGLPMCVHLMTVDFLRNNKDALLFVARENHIHIDSAFYETERTERTFTSLALPMSFYYPDGCAVVIPNVYKMDVQVFGVDE